MSTAAPFTATGATPYPRACPAGAVLMDASQIVPGPNDREAFAKGPLEELAASIASIGLKEPTKVMPCTVDGEETGIYQIIAGERRFRAMTQILGYTQVPVIVRDCSTEDAAGRRAAALEMFVENVLRENLNHIELAAAIEKNTRGEGAMTVEEFATATGYHLRKCRAALKLLRLNPEVQELVRTGDLQVGYANVLAESGLDANRQRIAMQHLNNERKPTLGWWRRVCGELAAQQQQVALLDPDDFLAAPTAAEPLASVAAADPDPVESIAPTTADLQDPVAALQTLLALHEETAQAWERRGRPYKRQEALASARAIRHALQYLPALAALNGTATATGARA